MTKQLLTFHLVDNISEKMWKAARDIQPNPLAVYPHQVQQASTILHSSFRVVLLLIEIAYLSTHPTD